MPSKPTSRPTRGAWIEIVLDYIVIIRVPSRPTRGAWIEMTIRKPLSTK